MHPAVTRAVLLLAAFAGCDDSVAIEIRVPDGIAAEEVELFLGVDRCKIDGDLCAGIGPKGRAFGRELGTVYDRDGNQAFRAPVVNGVAELKIAAENLKIATIIAIGQPADPASEEVLGAAQLFDIDLSAGAARYIETLQPVGGNDVGKPEAILWRRSDKVGCAGFRGVNAEVPTFIVAQGDPDCDEVEEALECDPLVYKAKVPAPGTACVTHGTAGGDQVCMLGSPVCLDGQGPSGCTAVNACIPERLCDCEGDPDPAACFRASVMLGELTHIECAFPLYQETPPDGDHLPCPDAELEARLDPMLFERACGQPELLLDVMTQTWGGKLDVMADATHTLSVHVVPTPEAVCRVSLFASGKGPTVLDVQVPRTLMRLPVPGANRTTLVPIDFSFVPVGDLAACQAGPQTCTLTFGPLGTTETIGSCGR